jgi:hypothetical protein
LVWATAATALHDLADKTSLTKEAGSGARQLIGIQDDPLAFLGILVDELQMWDRFLVHIVREVDLRSPIPESRNLWLSATDGRVSVAYDFPDGKQSVEERDRTTRELDKKLQDWSDVVEVLLTPESN